MDPSLGNDKEDSMTRRCTLILGLCLVFAKPWDDRELKRVIRDRLRGRELEGMLPED